jgi:hypothetical protein
LIHPGDKRVAWVFSRSPGERMPPTSTGASGDSHVFSIDYDRSRGWRDGRKIATSREEAVMADFNLTPVVVIWAVLAIATLGLALYRKLVSASEEDLVHLGPGEERQIPGQVALAARLTGIDRWGKVLTVITIAIGFTVAALYLYQAWLVHK